MTNIQARELIKNIIDRYEVANARTLTGWEIVALGTAVDALAAHKTGEWLEPEPNLYKCSVCGMEMWTNKDYIKEHKFCFKCGSHNIQDNNTK